LNKLILTISLSSIMVTSPSIVTTISNESKSLEDKQYHIALHGFNRAWEVTEGSPSVKIAVIDTGVDLNHHEFGEANFDSLSFNSNEVMVGLDHVMDDGGHGTNVVGVISANNRDGIGVSGVAPKLTIMVIKANKVPANIYSTVRVARGIRYAVENGAHIINLSMASATFDQGIADAIEYASSKDVLVVAAAGNNKSGTPYFPASLENVIAVSSIDDQKSFSTFSNYGSHIDIAAAGTRITMTRYSSHDPTLNPYSTLNGTSLAAPQVAAALGLIKTVNPQMTAQEIKNKLLATAKDAGEPGFDNYFGHGIMDVPAALGMSELVPNDNSSTTVTNDISSNTSSFNIFSTTQNSSETTNSEISISNFETGFSSEFYTSEPTNLTWNVKFLVFKKIHTESIVEDGQKVPNPQNPLISLKKTNSRMLIVFVGWYTESGVLYDFSSPVNGDLSLIAKFKLVKI
jgi:subtilisin family serine protease